jgi:leucyl-tRNA synthetase
MDQAAIEKAVLESDVYKKWSEGQQLKKFIVVKGRIINVVL